jgi:4-amino-4-deoxy-L-arabinose transferase-like glycosyltransferase
LNTCHVCQTWQVSLHWLIFAGVQQTFLSPRNYRILFGLLAIVYVIGLFVPLMDNDSAHHAVIALRMYLTGDYVNLVDHGKDYLDKPHLHFWLSAFSYSIFGVTTFAYKFPSFLFTILGTYATYRLGKSLYHEEVGRMSALIVASAFAYILANNDVRMDAILTGSVIFATWQLTDWVQHKKWINVLGAALGLALGFCTKGHIAVFAPGIGILFYIIYKKDWKSFYHPQMLLLIVSFFLFISPVVYCYYLQYDLHPDKVIRGESGRSGVEFILWKQNFERFQGDSFGADAKNDYLFFFHSFLWAFAPWSILAFAAFFSRLKSIRQRKYEWLTRGTFAVMALMLTFSGFKLPHYLNIIFPVSAVLTASYLWNNMENRLLVKRLFVIQIVLCILALVAAGIINTWAFPIRDAAAIGGFFLVLASVLYILKNVKDRFGRLISASVVTSVLVFYLLNANFYPQLLTYQAGNELARKLTVPDTGEGQLLSDPKKVYFWPGIYSSSYNFYTSEIRKEFHDSLLQQPGPLWIMVNNVKLPELEARGIKAIDIIGQRDYEITRLQLKFVNPARRNEVTGRYYLVRVK